MDAVGISAPMPVMATRFMLVFLTSQRSLGADAS
jgi:hypothetical protein